MHACWCSDVIEDAGNQLIEHLGWWQVVVGEMMRIGLLSLKQTGDEQPLP